MINFTNRTDNGSGHNRSSHETDSCPYHWYKLYWFYMDIFCVIGSLIGNFLVMFIVYRDKGMRNIMNYLFVCMSASDILAPAFLLAHDTMFVRGFGGVMNVVTATAMCKCLTYFLNTSITVSVLCLVAITVHRFYVVLFPFRARDKMRTRNICILIGLIWFTAVASMLPTALHFELSKESGKYECRYSPLEVFDILQRIFFRVVPLILMIVMYSVIIFTLKRQKLVGQSCSEREQRRRRQQSVSMTRMSLTIVFTFVFLIGTNEVFIALHEEYPNSCIVYRGISVTQAFVPFSSVVNPIIYFIFCKSYRSGLKKVFTRRGQSTMSQNTAFVGLSRLPTGRISSHHRCEANPRHSSVESNASLLRLANRISLSRGSCSSLNGDFRGSGVISSSFFNKGSESVVLTRFKKKDPESNQI